MQLRLWLNIQFLEEPFATSKTVETEVDYRRDAAKIIADEISRVRLDAERIEVRCILW